MDPESVEVYNIDDEKLNIDSSEDIENLNTPGDWILETCSVFGSGCKVEWICDDGGYIKVVPYPHPNHYIHSVDLSGRTKDIEGIENTISSCITFMRENTSCSPVRVKGPDSSYISYTKSLQSIDPIEEGKIDLSCACCDANGLVVISQSTNLNRGQEAKIEYELVCPVCESTMMIEETLDYI